MKKKRKVLIVFVLIVALAVGAYYFLTIGTNNKEIRVNVYNLNNSIIVDDVNIYTKINKAVDEMILLIDQRNFNIPATKEFLTVYSKTLKHYDFIRQEIIEHGVFVNNENTNKYFSNMKVAYDNLKQIYVDCNEYLLGTYFAITDSNLHNEIYIENFQNKFYNALSELNNFYFNAGMAYSYGVKNTFETSNAYKLNIGYYSLLVNCYASDYIEDGKFDLSIESNIFSIKNKINSLDVKKYLDNKSQYDDLMVISKKIDLIEVTVKYVTGEFDIYINRLKDATEKSNVEQYKDLVIEG